MTPEPVRQGNDGAPTSPLSPLTPASPSIPTPPTSPEGSSVDGTMEFVHQIVHEFRNSLHAMNFSTTALEATNPTSAQTQIISDMALVQEQMKRFVDDLLDARKLQEHKLSLVLQPFTLEGLKSLVLQYTSHRANARNLRLEFSFPLLSHALVGDVYRVKQILVNLVTNAIKFSPANSSIEISAEVLENDGLLRFAVRDFGGGIAKEDQEKLFGRFSQVGIALRGENQGSGLGLSICKMLAELMNPAGNEQPVIGIQSQPVHEEEKPMEGSLFWFTMELKKAPLTRQSSSSRLLAIPEASSSIQVGLPLSSVEILLADDSDVNRRLTHRILAKFGCTACETAVDGEDAKDKFYCGSYNVVLLDLYMPKLNGWEVAQKIRELERQTKRERAFIIAISGNSGAEEQNYCHNAGVDVLLTKPITPTLLISTIQKGLLPPPGKTH